MTRWGAEQVDELVGQLGGIALAAELRIAGMSKDVVQRLTDRGILHRLCRGAYTSGTCWKPLDQASRHGLAVRAQQRRDPERVATGLSAATIFGLLDPLEPPREPQLTHRRGAAHRGAPGCRGTAQQRRAWLADDEITAVAGILVTTPARTVIDCARHLDDGWALTVADRAAQAWDVTGDEVLQLIDRSRPSPGHRRARWVARHLDGRAACALESLARAVSIRAHLPKLTLNVTVGDGLSECQIALLDAENRIVIEADDPVTHQSPQALELRQLREDRLRELGLDICRFSYKDYSRPHNYLFRLRRAISRSRHRRALEARG